MSLLWNCRILATGVLQKMDFTAMLVVKYGRDAAKLPATEATSLVMVNDWTGPINSIEYVSVVDQTELVHT